MLRALVLACLVLLPVACGEVKKSDEDGGTDVLDGADHDGAEVDAVLIVYDAPPDATPCPVEPCQDGLACTSAAGCVSGNCECTDAECTVRVCAPAECLCGYGPDGSCTDRLTGGQPDPEDCFGASACFGGACLRIAGEACTANGECGSGQCECTDATCATRVCAAADCVCRYGAAGACTATLTSGSADPEDCAGTNACYAGECKKVLGEACIANTECGSDQCECVNSGCTTRVCAGASCTCRYGAGGSCASDMPNAVDDPEDCEAVSQSCYAGACRSENLGSGNTCYDDRQCASGNCECMDATCSARWCAAVSCTCRYNGSSTSAICQATYISGGYSDPTDCYGRVGCGLSGGGIDLRYCACDGGGGCVIKDPVFTP